MSRLSCVSRACVNGTHATHTSCASVCGTYSPAVPPCLRSLFSPCPSPAIPKGPGPPASGAVFPVGQHNQAQVAPGASLRVCVWCDWGGGAHTGRGPVACGCPAWSTNTIRGLGCGWPPNPHVCVCFSAASTHSPPLCRGALRSGQVHGAGLWRRGPGVRGGQQTQGTNAPCICTWFDHVWCCMMFCKTPSGLRALPCRFLGPRSTPTSTCGTSTGASSATAA